MKPSEQPYQPIACALHDRLEALAVRGRTVRILVRGTDGTLREIEDRVVDIFARDGEEFVRTAGGDRVRLDRLVQVDGVRYGPAEEGG